MALVPALSKEPYSLKPKKNQTDNKWSSLPFSSYTPQVLWLSSLLCWRVYKSYCSGSENMGPSCVSLACLKYLSRYLKLGQESYFFWWWQFIVIIIIINVSEEAAIIYSHSSVLLNSWKVIPCRELLSSFFFLQSILLRQKFI